MSEPEDQTPAEAEDPPDKATEKFEHMKAIQALRKAPVSRESLIQHAWRIGHLKHKLHKTQREAYDQIKASSGRYYLNWGRQSGKSYLLATLAIETAIQTHGAVIKVAAPTAKMVRQIIKPVYAQLLEDCPRDILPVWNTLDSEYRFKNGSVISIAGCDNGNAESLRGSRSHLNEFDECGFVTDPEYVVSSILVPMTLTTGGRTILASTPPRSSGHGAVALLRACERAGNYSHKTIYDNPMMGDPERDAFIANEAVTRGMSVSEFTSSTEFRREFMAEIVTDETAAVIPEWNDAKVRELVKILPAPRFFDTYVALDIGWRDPHGVLFGYWDFERACLVILDEISSKGTNTEALAALIKAKERELWGESKPYLRIADNDLLTLADLTELHGLTFIPTAKDDKELQVNNLRILIRQNKIVIHPRCVGLIEQLHTTVWNATRTSYDRNSSGHGDLVDAMVYMVRNLRRDHNPIPANLGISEDTHYIGHQTRRSASGQSIFRLFKHR